MQVSYMIRMILVITYLRPFAIVQSINVHVAITTSRGQQIPVGGKGETNNLNIPV